MFYGMSHDNATTADSWQQIASRPDTTADPECLRLESFKHLYIIKGLDACEPHHISWHHLQELTNTNWRCRENIINVMSDRYDQGSTVSQYCSCKPYMWSDNGQLKGAVKTTKKVLEGVAPVWESLKNCPSDIDVEGQPVSCQATIVKKMYDRFNGSLEQYENDRCFCYPSFGLKTVPADCTKYGGFSRLHVNGLTPNNCMTHFSGNIVSNPYASSDKNALVKVYDPKRCKRRKLMRYSDDLSLSKSRSLLVEEQSNASRNLLYNDVKSSLSRIKNKDSDKLSQPVKFLMLFFYQNLDYILVWKYLATQPAVCQDWIINFMLDQLNDDFSCDCHYYKEPPKTGHGVSFVGRSLNKRDTPFLPSCEHDSQGWKVMQTDFLSNVCRSHWYIWRHLADTHGHCRRYLINEMFAKFASAVPHCKCDSKMMSTPTPLPTTTMPPHMCSQCNGTSCDTGASVTCGTNQNFCMTSIIDYNDNNSGKLERLIERKCASKQECTDKDQSGNMFCLQLPQGNLGFPYTCRFCCVGSNCNNPPALIPALSTRFSSNFP
ncbi:unnamed protein product [Mytilus edulis]|uniref:Uncharacterized protein n=1 Tax=Mytilus edulis TaxID=6550 RepID=A0A8S3PWA9_MYTED|nr:unnamed protein product [Mytilus edulis]